MTELEVREVVIRGVDEEKREITGLAVPYGQVTEVGTYKEKFERGAFEDGSEATLFYGHDHRIGGLPIGKLVEARNSDEGFVVTAKISKTPKGDEVYALVRDGVLKSFSVGFEPVTHSNKDGVVVRTKANLKEVSIVPMPAYAGANIAEVRESTNTKENETMTENIDNNSEVVELREAFNDLERKVAVLNERGASAGTSSTSIHPGEMLKGLASNDESARMEVRAFTGATLSDTGLTSARPSWVNERLRLPLENRNFLNLFSKAALPASGNTLEYPVVTGATGTVGVQANEGDDLPYMEVTLGSATAPVKTYGGYSSLSRQSIERSDVAYLETVLEYQVRQYAKATNLAVRSAFTAATGTNTGAIVTGTAKGADWLTLAFNGAALIEDTTNGSQAAYILMNRVNYLKLVALSDTTNRPVFDLNGDGANTFGNLRVAGAQGSLAGLPIVVDNSLANGFIYIVAADAVKVFESAGAPYRLQDENVINLTKDFSLYGYMAVAITNPLGIVKVTVT